MVIARKLFFYVLPPLVLASIIGGVYWHTRPEKEPVGDHAPDAIIGQPALPEANGVPGASDAPATTTSAPAVTPQENSQEATDANARPDDGQMTPRALTPEELMAKAPAFSDSPFWAKLLAQTTPAMRLVKAIDAVANGQRPLDALDFLHVNTPYSARKNDAGDWVATAESYARYQSAVDFVDSLDPQKVAEWFTMAEPVLQQCCKQLGYQDKSIRTLLTEACSTVLATPHFEFEPQLVPTGTTGTFHYADPAFEKLNDAQKLLVRLGPANCAKIQAKCEAIADALKLYR